MTEKGSMVKRFLALALCLSLLLGGTVSLAEEAVTNVTDAEGPILSDLTFKENGESLKPGKVLHLSVRVRDRSGVSWVNAEFWNEDYDRYEEMSLEYDADKDLYVGERELTKSWINGVYQLIAVNAADRYGNQSRYWSNSDALGLFKLTGATSGKAKKAKVNVTVKENGQTVKPLTKIHVQADLKTKLSDVAGITVEFENETGYEDPVRVSVFCEYKPDSKKYEGTFTFGFKNDAGKTICEYANGTYEIATAYVEYGAQKTARAELGGQSVTLTGGIADLDPPVITSGKITEKGKTLKPGRTLHIKAKVKDSSGVDYVSAFMVSADSDWSWEERTGIGHGNYPEGFQVTLSYNKSSKTWEGSYQLPDTLANGTYYLSIEAADKHANWGYEDFEKQIFKFKGPDLVTDGIRSFVQEVFNTVMGRAAEESEITEYGMKLAEGRDTAVVTVKAVAKKAGLTKEETVKRLYTLMKGSDPSAEEQAEGTATLEKANGLETLIDILAENKLFRENCEGRGILVGTFGRRSDGAELGTIAVTKIKLNKKKATLKLGGSKKEKTITLSATVSPDEATRTDVEWSSSDPSVAKVSKKGKVTAVGAGKCVITCTAKDGSGVKATCKITVK